METLKIDSSGKIHLNAHQIYHWLVRRGEDGEYCYYTKPWTEKICFILPGYVVKLHDEGNLKSLTLTKWFDDGWDFHSHTIYTRKIISRDSYRSRDFPDLITQKKRQL